MQPTPASSARRSLRRLALALATGGALFWLYTFHVIARLPSGDGSGLQWLAVVPLGTIFVTLTLPALLLAAAGRLLRLSAVLGLVGLVAFAIVWVQLLGEFHFL